MRPRRCIARRSRRFNHYEVAINANNLAALAYRQGRHDEAKTLWLRALSIKEKILGVRHPEIATTLTNLGVLAHAQGHHAEAQELFKRALALLEGLVTADHPVWRAAEDNLATTRRQSLTSSPRSP